MDGLYVSVIIVLCTLGICYIIEWLCDLVMIKSSAKNSIIIPVDGKTNDIEYIIRSTKYKHEKIRDNLDSIILLDLGANKETIDICRLMVKDSDNVNICRLNELKEFVKKNE